MGERVRLFALGIGFLALSLLVAVLTPEPFTPGDRGAVFAVWVEHAAFWLGILCLAAHLLTLVLDRHSRR